MKKTLKILSGICFSALILSCSNNSFGLGNFNMNAIAITRVDLNQTTMQTRIKWDNVWGVEYYELSRVVNGKETIVGTSKISKNINSFVDKDYKNPSKFKYKMYALDINNKPIAKAESKEIELIDPKNIAEINFSNYSMDSKNIVTREDKLKWSQEKSADFYYSTIKDSISNNQIMGTFSKTPEIDLNVYTSPLLPPELILGELPIVTKNGLEKNTNYKFSVYSIKVKPDAQDLKNVDSVIMKQSKEIIIGL
jgi:hypothetical protein